MLVKHTNKPPAADCESTAAVEMVLDFLGKEADLELGSELSLARHGILIGQADRHAQSIESAPRRLIPWNLGEDLEDFGIHFHAFQPVLLLALLDVERDRRSNDPSLFERVVIGKADDAIAIPVLPALAAERRALSMHSRKRRLENVVLLRLQEALRVDVGIEVRELEAGQPARAVERREELILLQAIEDLVSVFIRAADLAKKQGRRWALKVVSQLL